jgi:ammonia channel protein AmtB
MPDDTRKRRVPKVGTYAFVIALVSALVLPIAWIGMNLATASTARRVLAWLSMASLISMFGGIAVFLYYVAREITQK